MPGLANEWHVTQEILDDDMGLPHKKLDLMATGVLDLSQANQYVPSAGGILVPPEVAYIQKYSPGIKGTHFDYAVLDDVGSTDLYAKAMQSKYAPGKDNFSKDRQIAVLKAMVASFLVGRDDCKLEISGEAVGDANRHFPVRLVYFPNNQTYVAALE